MVANLGRIKREREALEVQLRELSRRLPSEHESAQVLRSVETIAGKSGLTVGQVRRRPNRPQELYVEIPMEVGVGGGYHDLLKFADQLAQLPRLVTLNELKVLGRGRAQAPGSGAWCRPRPGGDARRSGRRGLPGGPGARSGGRAGAGPGQEAMTEGTMRQRRSSGSGWTRLVAALFASLLAAAAWAQSQPKFPVPLPTPKAPAPSTAPDPTPAPAAPAAPAAGAPATTGPAGPVRAPGAEARAGRRAAHQEIANLKLVGVMWDPKDTEAIRALVETPDGLGYYLRLNEEKFGGKVVAVERDRVRFVVREEVPGAGSRERTVELRLSKPDGQ